MTGCRDEPTAATAPFVVEPSLASPSSATVGTVLSPAPTFVVRNAGGQLLANTPVTVAITAGNGTLDDAPARTGTGPTSVGRWVLDTIAGVNALTILAGSAPPVSIEIVGVAGAPATIRIVGNNQSGLAGDVLAQPLEFEVIDRFGNPIPGLDVVLSIAEGGGEVSIGSVKTGGGSTVEWRLGRRGGSQRIVASSSGLSISVAATIRSDYLPIVRFHGASPAAELASAFARATERLHATVTGDASAVPVFNFDLGRCGLSGSVLSEVIDDVVIYAISAPVDGVGKVLASAGPCIVRSQSRSPVIGVMRFDAEDLPLLAASGNLDAIVLHEMLHVLGIGSGWRSRNLIVGSGTPDPQLISPQAALHCVVAGGAESCGTGTVPIENTGGGGTAEVHWRETVFDAELMTGYVEYDVAMPLSSMTVGSLVDLGYTVNLHASDPFQVPVPGAVAPRLSAGVLAPWESVTAPLFEVTVDGWVRPLPREK
jgi:hypothetical protein